MHVFESKPKVADGETKYSPVRRPVKSKVDAAVKSLLDDDPIVDRLQQHRADTFSNGNSLVDVSGGEIA